MNRAWALGQDLLHYRTAGMSASHPTSPIVAAIVRVCSGMSKGTYAAGSAKGKARQKLTQANRPPNRRGSAPIDSYERVKRSTQDQLPPPPSASVWATAPDQLGTRPTIAFAVAL